eukprot:TRINITY_DN9460_c0_g1_i1.p1 TRINITY_DN9460_c0_g1~~TRINITY_DN9460_c0_g1_i1.p1  ORF type:complete len:752 (+),score=285.30 TRINITY_DN9460_c0_g1_i1:71-2326(+)
MLGPAVETDAMSPLRHHRHSAHVLSSPSASIRALELAQQQRAAVNSPSTIASGLPTGALSAAEAVREALRRGGLSELDACVGALESACADAEGHAGRSRKHEAALRELEAEMASERALRADAESRCGRLLANLRDLQLAVDSATAECRRSREEKAQAEAELSRAQTEATGVRMREEAAARRRLEEAEAALAHKSLLADERMVHAQELRRCESEAEQLRVLLRDSERLLERQARDHDGQLRNEKLLRDRATEELNSLRERSDVMTQLLARKEAEEKGTQELVAGVRRERDAAVQELEKCRSEVTQLHLRLAAAETRRAELLLAHPLPPAASSAVSPCRVGQDDEEARAKQQQLAAERDAALRDLAEARSQLQAAREDQKRLMATNAPSSVNVILPRRPHSFLGIELDDELRLVGVARNSAAEDFGVAAYIGWRLTAVNGRSVASQPEIAAGVRAVAENVELVLTSPPQEPPTLAADLASADGTQPMSAGATAGCSPAGSPIASPAGSPRARIGSPQLTGATEPAPGRHAHVDPLASPRGLVHRQATPMPGAAPHAAAPAPGTCVLPPDGAGSGVVVTTAAATDGYVAVTVAAGQVRGCEESPPPAEASGGTSVATTAPSEELVHSPDVRGMKGRVRVRSPTPGAVGAVVQRELTPAPPPRHAEVDPLASPRGMVQRLPTPIAHGAMSSPLAGDMSPVSLNASLPEALEAVQPLLRSLANGRGSDVDSAAGCSNAAAPALSTAEACSIASPCL